MATLAQPDSALLEQTAMGSFGEKMQREREMRTITLEEIAESTKIGTRMLHALEEEDFSKLPGGIFNKGFVRAYAKYLGLDEEQAVTDFMASYSEFQAAAEHPIVGMGDAGANGAAGAETISSLQASAESSLPAQGAGLITAAVVLVVVLGAGGFFFKYYSQKKASAANSVAVVGNPTKSRAEKRKAQESAHPGEMPAPIQPHAGALDSSLSPVTSVFAANSQPSNNTRELRSEATVPEFKKSELANPSADAAATNTSQKMKVNLQIRTKEESWVKITADGQILMEGMLSPSASREFKAAKEMIVKLGNAAVVELSYNGKPLPAFTPDTKTKTLTFTPDGPNSQ